MSWEKKKLGELCSITKGKIGISKAISGEYPLVVTSEARKSHNEFHFEGEAVVIPLVSSTGHGHRSLKRIHYQTGKFAVGSILCAVIPNDDKILNAEFLYRFLDLNREKELVNRMRGMANVTLPMKEIANVEVPLPPLDEQIKFVAEYKKLETANNTLSTEITNQLKLVKQLRQSFLREAMQGKLVEQNKTDEPATELLAKIKAEKVQLIKEKKIKKQKPLAPITKEEIPFEIPENWVWCRLGEVANNIHYGFNASAKPNKDEVRLLRITDIQDNKVEWNTVPGCDFSEKDLKSYLLKENDIVIARTGGTIGKSYIVKDITIKSLFASYLIRVIPNSLTNADFLKLFLESPDYWKQLYEAAWGAGQPNVNATKLNSLILSIPPISEQKRIVVKLDKLMSYCDRLEESIKNSQTQNEMLLGQVLREALEPSTAKMTT